MAEKQEKVMGLWERYLTLYGTGSGAALATVVGVLIEVPIMLMLVRFCIRTRDWFPSDT